MFNSIPGGPKPGNNQTQRQAPPPKPFAPLGNRKALVEKSGLVKHATNKSKREKLKQQTDSKGTTNRLEIVLLFTYIWNVNSYKPHPRTVGSAVA